MSVVIDPSFGGWDYAANNCDVATWNEQAGPRRALSSVPRSHVARAQDGFLSPRLINISGVIGNQLWTTRDNYRAARDAFLWAHRPGYRTLQMDTDRYVTAEVRNVTLGDDHGLLWAPYKVQFECADPYWHNVNAQATDVWSLVAAPAAPALATATTGGTLPAGLYWVKLCWVTAAGEFLAGIAGPIVTTGTTSTITVTPPAAPGGVTGYNVYAPSPVALTTGAGTVAASGTTVTGSGTTFTTLFSVGMAIVIAGQVRVVQSIASDTSLTVTAAFSPAIGAGAAYQSAPAEPADSAKWRQNGNTPATAGATYTFTALVSSGNNPVASVTFTHTNTNPGVADVLPQFTLLCDVGTYLSAVLTDLSATPATSMTLAGTVAAGQSLVIDCAGQTVQLAGANAMNMLTAGSFFSLPAGVNNLQLVLSTSNQGGIPVTGSLTSLSIDYSQRFL